LKHRCPGHRRVRRPVCSTKGLEFTVSYAPASDSIEIKLGATETFPTGGQLTVLGGLMTASGDTLTGPAVLTIAKGGKSITLS
jgi:hypothetical protein